jgi:hypothetical protein
MDDNQEYVYRAELPFWYVRKLIDGGTFRRTQTRLYRVDEGFVRLQDLDFDRRILDSPERQARVAALAEEAQRHECEWREGEAAWDAIIGIHTEKLDQYYRLTGGQL